MGDESTATLSPHSEQATQVIGSHDSSTETPVNSALPLLSIQRGVLFEQLRAPESPSHNIGGRAELHGPPDARRLERAAMLLVDRFDVLRTVLRETDDGVLQQVLPSATPQYALVEFGSRAEALGWIEEEFARAFSLFDKPLYRLRIARFAPTQAFILSACHHVLFDGWSSSLLAERLLEAYDHLSIGTPFPPSGLGLRALAASEAAYQRSPAYEADARFWRARLELEAGGLFPATDLRNSPAHVIRETLPRANYDRLAGIGARESAASAFHCILALLQLVVARSFRAGHVLFGVSVAGRQTEQLRATLGPVTNAILLPVALDHGQRFSQAVRAIEQELRHSYRHRRFPFVDLPRTLRSGGALIPDVNVTLLKLPFREVRSHGLHLQAITQLPNPYGSKPIQVFVDEGDGVEPVRLDFIFNPSWFTQDAGTALARRMLLAAEAIVRAPETPLRQIELLAPHERHVVLDSWNQTAISWGEWKCIHRQFERQVDRTPDAPAVISAGGTVTYAQLDLEANRLANHLLTLGAGPDVRIAVCCDRSPRAIAACLAVWKAGACYLPLDPTHPAERLALLVRDAGARILLATTELATPLRASVDQVLCLDQGSDKSTDQRDTRPDVKPRAEDLAYVIYTSGSTGMPKGVMIPHGAAASLANALRHTFLPKPSDRILQFASPAFDAAIAEVLMALTSGAALCLADSEQRRPGDPLARAICDLRVSFAILPPSCIGVLEPGVIPTLRTLISVGEACPLVLGKQWWRRCNFFNAYGPTEAAVCATASITVPGEGSIPIGRPLANVRLYVLDECMAPVPIGVTGELYIGGAGLARGYLARPALTSESFVADPFSCGERLYRTGDLVRYRPDGELEFLGRLGHQIKLRGYRIELGEIEAALLSHPSVAQAAVLHHQDNATQARLVAYVTPRRDAAPEPRVLRSHLRCHLPDYMIPSAFVVLDVMPTSTNGKLDRRKLPSPDAGSQRNSRSLPCGTFEEGVAAIWTSVLGLPSVGADDSFFDIGGHSLALVRVRTGVRERFGIDLELTDLLVHPTVRSLAARIAGKSKDSGLLSLATLAETRRRALADAGRRRATERNQLFAEALHERAE